jgi:predicted aspartyl protease
VELETMGRVTVEAKIENLLDVMKANLGEIDADRVREVSVPDALVDTGATALSLPTSIIRELGLTQTGTKNVRTTAGLRTAAIYSSARLTVQGRDCEVAVAEVPDGTPVLIGQIPLEYLDFVVDPRGQRLIGNPDHNGEWMYDSF